MQAVAYSISTLMRIQVREDYIITATFHVYVLIVIQDCSVQDAFHTTSMIHGEKFRKTFRKLSRPRQFYNLMRWQKYITYQTICRTISVREGVVENGTGPLRGVVALEYVVPLERLLARVGVETRFGFHPSELLKFQDRYFRKVHSMSTLFHNRCRTCKCVLKHSLIVTSCMGGELG